jgi:hypothetical protein
VSEEVEPYEAYALPELPTELDEEMKKLFVAGERLAVHG